MGFMDLRQWLRLLEKEGELRRIGAEVHWDRELGAVARRVLEKKGPALLFENVAGYKTGRCTKLCTGGLGDRRRLALALGFPRDVSNAELVQHVMTKNREAVPPRVVKTGPVKDVIVKGAAIDQNEFPVPRWHHLEGGRYIHTFSGIVTRDPDTRVMNVGIYRGMIGKPDTCPMLLIKGGQHWGHHFQKYSDRGEPMPVACVIGWDPIMPFLAGSPIPTGVCEWDVMGAYRGEPAELVKCETVDLEVQIRKAYQGQPKQIAAALWGNSAAQYRYKHVFVVDDDIDPSSYEQIDWALAHRVNAGEGGLVVFPGIFGSPIDPSTPMEDRDVSRLGTGLWNRVLFDATRSWKFPRRAEWGNERFPPTVRPAAEDEARVRRRWTELGLG